MSDRVIWYRIKVVREPEDNVVEAGYSCLISTMRSQSDDLQKAIFLSEMEKVWDRLHRAIRTAEVGEP